MLSPRADDAEPERLSIASAMWRYRVVVASILAAATLISGTYVLAHRKAYTATATLIVEDPRNAPLLGQLTVESQQRYVADQVAMLQSVNVANDASRLAHSA